MPWLSVRVGLSPEARHDPRSHRRRPASPARAAGCGFDVGSREPAACLPRRPSRMSVAAALAFLGENPLKRPLEDVSRSLPSSTASPSSSSASRPGGAQPAAATGALRATEALRARARAAARRRLRWRGVHARVHRARASRGSACRCSRRGRSTAAVLPLEEWLRRAPADAAGAWAESLRALHERATVARRSRTSSCATCARRSRRPPRTRSCPTSASACGTSRCWRPSAAARPRRRFTDGGGGVDGRLGRRGAALPRGARRRRRHARRGGARPRLAARAGAAAAGGGGRRRRVRSPRARGGVAALDRGKAGRRGARRARRRCAARSGGALAKRLAAAERAGSRCRRTRRTGWRSCTASRPPTAPPPTRGPSCGLRRRRWLRAATSARRRRAARSHASSSSRGRCATRRAAAAPATARS